MHLFGECERARSSVLRLEPVFVIVEVERGDGEHPPEDVRDGRRSPVVVVDGRYQPERVAHHHKEGDLAGIGIF